MSWYVVVNRKRLGPLSTEQLSEQLQAGRVPPDAWTWTEGMDEWVPAGEIQALRPRPAVQRVMPQPQPQPQIEAVRAPRPAAASARTASRKPRAQRPPTASESTDQSWQQKLGDLLLRHWRGELPLPVSYWVMSLAATFVVFTLGGIVGAFDIVDAPQPVAIAILLFLAVAAAIVVWQLVGVWRSAENYRARGGPKIWAQLAMGLTALSALQFVVNIVLVQAPVALEMLRIIDGDKEFADYDVVVREGGGVLSIEGPIGFGLTARVDDALASFGNVRVVRLNSGGGRLAEAYRLGERIRDRGLSTHVEQECSSACVIAFASGAERLLGPDARIGLHEVSFPGMAPRWSESERRKYIQFLKGQGANAGFVNAAMRRGGSGMWYPTHQELIDAGIASAMAEDGEFDDVTMEPL
ncbi:MAG: GYF domain-containing protein [Steroidobacteraceae bacterium]